jgi:hypothetical protein
MKLSIPDEKLEVKIKFFKLNSKTDQDYEDGESQRLRMRLVKKKGNLARWYEIFNDMRETVFENVLLAPKLH